MFRFLRLQIWVVSVVVGLFLWPANADAASGLKSAYLGSSVWDDDLSAEEINDQVKGHFAAAIVQWEPRMHRA